MERSIGVLEIPVEPQASRAPETSFPETSFSEASWQAWRKKNWRNEQRDYAWRMDMALTLAVAAVLAHAVFLPYPQPLQVASGLLVSATALAAAVRAYTNAKPVLGALLGIVVMAANPVAAPLFDFSEEWQRSISAISALPLFLALLAFPMMRAKTATAVRSSRRP